MKKFSSLFLAFLAGTLLSIAQVPGDTLHIAGHDNVHMNWYGNYDQAVTFPETEDTYRQILMKFTLSCPSGGCSDWDYDVEIYKRHDTGILDSNLVSYPDFQVDGSTVDSIAYNTDTTYVTFFGNDTSSTDSIINVVTIQLFGDSLNPTTQTDSMTVFLGDYYNYYYDSLGVVVDSIWVDANNTMNVEYYEQYEYFNKIINIELGRIVTPYAAGLDNTWSREYYFDITDFASILEAEQTIRAKYSGWSDGFTVTLDYYFIYGTPTRTVKEIHPLWSGYYAFGKWEDNVHTIENKIKDYTFNKGDASHAKLKFTPSGHGMADQNCAEFCIKSYIVEFNGQDQYENNIWKDDCGSNAQFPQPGTWLYDRANWCPGELVPIHEYELGEFLVSGENTIDVDFDSYHNNSSNGAGYQIAGNLITYGDWNFNNNAALEEILAPTKAFDHSRFNPICGRPEVRIKNNGGEDLTSCTIEYGITGVFNSTYNWTGSIDPLESKDILLPAFSPWFYAQELNNNFYARVVSPNGQTDEDLTDNEKVSSFDIVEDLPSEFTLKVKTNTKGYQTNWYIKNVGTGEIAYSGSNLDNSTTYEIEMNFEPGCYEFQINDTGKNGLKWWADNDGSGLVRFIKTNSPGTVKAFTPDFGAFINYKFTVGVSLSTEETNLEEVHIVPNPSNGVYTVSGSLNTEKDVKIEVYNALGKLVYFAEMNGEEIYHTIDIKDHANGVYIVKVISGDLISTKKLIKY